MKTTTCSTICSISGLIAVTSLAMLATANRALAIGVPPSDELLITGPMGAPVLFDNFLPQPPPGGIESSIAFTGGPAPVPVPVPLPVLLGTPGVDIVALTEPAGLPPEPGEVPIVIPGPNGSVVLSDLIVSTLNHQTALPPFVGLYSDGAPELQQITGLPPTTVLLTETGVLQNLTPFLLGTGPGGPFGPISVFVRSDVPEPAGFVLAGIGLLVVAATRWRRKKACFV